MRKINGKTGGQKIGATVSVDVIGTLREAVAGMRRSNIIIEVVEPK
jgi:hypothetical protein